MKTYKPYLSLGKGSAGDYTLDVVFQSPKSQNIVGIEQKEIIKNGKSYWGVIISVSSDIQIICGPESNVLFASITIAGNLASTYKTIKCLVRVTKPLATGLDDPDEDETDIDFGDNND
ncbi:MAG: hypothetical protein ACK5JD_02520 [Mangrovibacterium sp.]